MKRKKLTEGESEITRHAKQFDEKKYDVKRGRKAPQRKTKSNKIKPVNIYVCKCLQIEKPTMNTMVKSVVNLFKKTPKYSPFLFTTKGEKYYGFHFSEKYDNTCVCCCHGLQKVNAKMDLFWESYVNRKRRDATNMR